MDAQTLLRSAFESRRSQYRKRLKACRRRFSEKAVRRLRVANRRLCALLDGLRRSVRASGAKSLRTSLKHQLDSLNALRDTQMMLLECDRARLGQPAAARLAFVAYLKRRERRLLADAERELRQQKVKRLNRRLQIVHERLEGLDGGAALARRLFGAVDEAYAATLERWSRIDPRQPDTFHRARISFKRFRYTFEILHPLLEDRGVPARPAALRELQSAMGAVQDLSVLLRMLLSFSLQRGAPPLHPLQRYYRKRLFARSAVLLRESDLLRACWRPAPDKPFPQEVSHAPAHHSPRHRRSARNSA